VPQLRSATAARVQVRKGEDVTEQERINRRKVLQRAFEAHEQEAWDNGYDRIQHLDPEEVAVALEEAVYQDEHGVDGGPGCECELRHHYSPTPEIYGRKDRDRFEVRRDCEIHRGCESYMGGVAGLVELARRDASVRDMILEAGFGEYVLQRSGVHTKPPGGLIGFLRKGSKA
jgi:hypothetical protein